VWMEGMWGGEALDTDLAGVEIVSSLSGNVLN
jgi:hypothetical protein